MPSLYIANIRTDYAEKVRAATGLSAHSRAGSDTCARFVWHMQPDDILVSPDFIFPEFIEYVARSRAIDSRSLRVLSTGGFLDDAYLGGESLFLGLRDAIDFSLDWKIEAFLVTPGIVSLAERLGFERPSGHLFVTQGGVQFINLKSSFRTIAAGLGTPVPEGISVRSVAELQKAIVDLKKSSDALIVKHERGGGGRGNIGLAEHPRAGLPGTRATRSMSQDVSVLAQDLWDELADESSPQVTVETYVMNARPFYSEWLVTATDSGLIATGEIRYAANASSEASSPSWVGLSLPHIFGESTSHSVVLGAYKFIEQIRKLGYRGYVNIDGLVDSDGRVFFHEINARWGGGLVVATILERLFGAKWANEFCALTVLDITSKPLEVVLQLLERTGLAYDTSSSEGTLILGVDSDLGRGCEFLIIAKNSMRLIELEARLRDCFLTYESSFGQPASGHLPIRE